jgi:hypothetical protein
MNEVSKDSIPEEFALLAPYLLEMSVSCNGIDKEMVFYFPEPSPIELDPFKMMEKFDFSVEFDRHEPDPFSSVFEVPRIIGTRVTISNKGFRSPFGC